MHAARAAPLELRDPTRRMMDLSPGRDHARHVVIVGINYAPEETGIAPYTTAMAEHLASRYAVTVLTGMPHYPAWQISSGYRGKLSAEEQRGGVTVRRYASYVPAHQTALRRAAYEASFLVNAGRAQLGLRRPDAIVGIVPALSDAVLARLLAARFRSPYGIVFQDMMGRAAAQSGIAGGTRVAKAAERIEGWSARGAAGVATIAERFVPYLRALGVADDRIVHLPNWAHVREPIADRAATRARLGWQDRTAVVLHAGNMGLKQGLEQVLDAAALAQHQGAPVQFAFIGDGSQRELLLRRAAHMPNVTFHGFQPASQFSDVLAAADVLLVSERPTAVDMSLPGKLTSYFRAGRPVLAAVAPDGATAREVQRSGAGLVVPAGDPQAILDAVRTLHTERQLAERLATAGRTYVARALTAEAGLARAERFVASLIASRGGRVASDADR